MSASALERSLASTAALFGSWVRGHDRFVVIGLLFSLLPLPPACFLGLLVSLANIWLISTGTLHRQETKLVRWALLLGVVNSGIAIFGMLWVWRYFQNMHQLIHLPFMPDALNHALNYLLDSFREQAQPAPENIPISRPDSSNRQIYFL